MWQFTYCSFCTCVFVNIIYAHCTSQLGTVNTTLEDHIWTSYSHLHIAYITVSPAYCIHNKSSISDLLFVFVYSFISDPISLEKFKNHNQLYIMSLLK